MKVIIDGSRIMPWRDSQTLITHAAKKLNLPITEVVSGCAEGADTWGEKWAHVKKIKTRKFPADWKRFGKSAGIIRNIDMGDYADAAIIFLYGHSRGSEHMLNYMKHLKKPYLSVFDGEIDYAF